MLFILPALLGLLLASCTRVSDRSAPLQPLPGRLFQLRAGRFIPLAGAEQMQEVAPRPWTVQGRVAAMLPLGERVYLGVNGSGIAELTAPGSGDSSGVRFEYHYDPLLFGFRTLTTLLPGAREEAQTVLCHLYFNALLNELQPAELKIRGVSLLELDPSSGRYRVLPVAFQQAHPEWEAVGFIPETTTRFHFEWKYSDANRTLFSYSLFDRETGRNAPSDAQAFRRAYRFQDVEAQGGPALRRLLAEARRVLDAPGICTAYQILLREEGQPLPRRYEYHPEGFTRAESIRIITLPGVSRAGRVALLLPEGLMLGTSAGSRNVERLRLPSLPPGHLYTGLALHRGLLLAPFERSVFTRVGAAGLFVGNFP